MFADQSSFPNSKPRNTEASEVGPDSKAQPAKQSCAGLMPCSTNDDSDSGASAEQSGITGEQAIGTRLKWGSDSAQATPEGQGKYREEIE